MKAKTKRAPKGQPLKARGGSGGSKRRRTQEEDVLAGKHNAHVRGRHFSLRRASFYTVKSRRCPSSDCASQDSAGTSLPQPPDHRGMNAVDISQRAAARRAGVLPRSGDDRDKDGMFEASDSGGSEGGSSGDDSDLETAQQKKLRLGGAPPQASIGRR